MAQRAVGDGLRSATERQRTGTGDLADSEGLEDLEQEGHIVTARIAGGQAAFLFELATKAGDQTYTLAPIDVMTFDDDAKITSMKAYWGDSDMTVS